MEALAATVRQIDKRSVTESSNVFVHDRDGAVLSQTQQSMKAGDFYFRAAVEETTESEEPATEPKSIAENRNEDDGDVDPAEPEEEQKCEDAE